MILMNAPIVGKQKWEKNVLMVLADKLVKRWLSTEWKVPSLLLRPNHFHLNLLEFTRNYVRISNVIHNFKNALSISSFLSTKSSSWKENYRKIWRCSSVEAWSHFGKNRGSLQDYRWRTVEPDEVMQLYL